MAAHLGGYERLAWVLSIPVAVSLNSVLPGDVWTWGFVPKTAQSFCKHCLRKTWPQCQYVIHSFHSTHKVRLGGHFLRLTEQDAKQLVANLKRCHILAVSYLFLHLSDLQSLDPWLSQHTSTYLFLNEWISSFGKTRHSRSGGKLQIFFSKCCVLASGLITGQMLCCGADGSQQCASMNTWIFA